MKDFFNKLTKSKKFYVLAAIITVAVIITVGIMIVKFTSEKDVVANKKVYNQKKDIKKATSKYMPKESSESMFDEEMLENIEMGDLRQNIDLKVDTEMENINSDRDGYIAYKDRMYFTFKRNIYSCNLDGTDNKLVGDILYAHSKIIGIYDEKIIYSSGDDGVGTAYYDLKTNKNKEIYDGYLFKIENTKIIGDTLYFKDATEKIIEYNFTKKKLDTYGPIGTDAKFFKSSKGHMWIYNKKTLGVKGHKAITPDNSDQFGSDSDILNITEYGDKLYVFTYVGLDIYNYDDMKMIASKETKGFVPIEQMYGGDIFSEEKGYIYMFDGSIEKFRAVAYIGENYVEKVRKVDNVLIVDNKDLKRSDGSMYISIYKNKKGVGKLLTNNRNLYFVSENENAIYYYDIKEKIYKKYNY